MLCILLLLKTIIFLQFYINILITLKLLVQNVQITFIDQNLKINYLYSMHLTIYKLQ